VDAFVIAADDPRRSDVRQLLEQHRRFATAVMPGPEDVHALEPQELLDTTIAFFSVRLDGELLGIGAIKQLEPEHVELKSMHTTVAARRRGVARALLDHLLAVAAAGGARRVSLETGAGDAFVPARALYEAAGFVPCGPFGDYASTENNAFMTRFLT
jgi:putative acetyltransferase